MNDLDHGIVWTKTLRTIKTAFDGELYASGTGVSLPYRKLHHRHQGAVMIGIHIEGVIQIPPRPHGRVARTQ
ncbi:hypothetical protein SDC9_147039 [bioreactor metagenome]|uniref:Uncharacterized protein n=1 Tax=bioreactor metagenome TaxID=1076179 RepID=A0A645ECT2_9ZZZZ